MQSAKGLVGYVVLAVCILLAYQGYQNSTNTESTEALAKSVACDVDSQCLLKTERPGEIRTDMISRQYAWRSNVGDIDVTCRRGAGVLRGLELQPKA